MDNPAVEIWASLAKFKLKSLNLYFWLDWILEWVRESGESIVIFRGLIYAGSTYVARLQKHQKITT